MKIEIEIDETKVFEAVVVKLFEHMKWGQGTKWSRRFVRACCRRP